MRKKDMRRAFMLMLICIFVLSACKKNVGTPEDNAVSDESQEEETTDVEDDTYVFGLRRRDLNWSRRIRHLVLRIRRHRLRR